MLIFFKWKRAELTKNGPIIKIVTVYESRFKIGFKIDVIKKMLIIKFFL